MEPQRKKDRHTCTGERVCGCVKRDKKTGTVNVDDISMNKCAEYLKLGITRTFCGLTNRYVYFERR